MRITVKSPLEPPGKLVFELDESCTVDALKQRICHIRNLPFEKVIITLNSDVLCSNEVLGGLNLGPEPSLGYAPSEISAAVDEESLMSEYRYIRKQFPLVKMEDLMTYTGRLRCERGPVWELAKRDVWPFTEYVKWHEFRMVLSMLHPFKPPTVTWLTDISHPNIIPRKKGKVCVSILGKKWLPNTKLAAVINALYFLLYDPNPYSAYPVKRCNEVAKICRMYGFPKRRPQATMVVR